VEEAEVADEADEADEAEERGGEAAARQVMVQRGTATINPHSNWLTIAAKGVVSPSQIPHKGEVVSVLYAHQSKQLIALPRGQEHILSLAPREWEVFTVQAVVRCSHTSWAPLGLLSMLNGGGALVDSSVAKGLGRAPQARVSLRASDTFGAYCRPRPRAVRVEGSGSIEFEYDESTGLLSVPLPREAVAVRLTVDFPRRRGVAKEALQRGVAEAPSEQRPAGTMVGK